MIAHQYAPLQCVLDYQYMVESSSEFRRSTRTREVF